MTNIIKVFQDFFFNQERKFLSLFSFFLMSLVSLHFLVFFSFFSFSSKWIDNESRMSFFEIQPGEDERKIPEELETSIIYNLNKDINIKNVEKIDNYQIQEFLDLDRKNEVLNIRLPLFITLEFKKDKIKKVNNDVINLIGKRNFELYSHIDQLTDVINLINKIKVFILTTGSLLFSIFIFFLSLIIKTTFNNNYKFLEIIEIMGASSRLISLNVSIILIKKIMPGIVLGMVSSMLIIFGVLNLFDIPFDFINFYSFREFSTNFIILGLSIIVGIISVFLCLYFFILNFLEKRFFVETE